MTISNDLSTGLTTSRSQRFWDLLKRFGKNSNSFMSAYGGYHYFESPKGMIAYVETRGAWGGAGDPLADPKDYIDLLKEFLQAAARSSKCALLVGAHAETAQAAEAAGFGSILIGSEPIFELDRYFPHPSMLETAKRLKAKGAQVEEFRPEDLSAAELAKLDAIKDEWLGSRRTEALSFLNRVEPWSLREEKKYFSLTYGGTVHAFIAAVPVKATGGWYLVDVLRRTQSPVGTTELLILMTMSHLRNQGAREISLGVAPLAGLDSPGFQGSSTGQRILKFFHRNFKAFYNFDSLKVFKEKFGPTRSDGAFLIYSPKFFSPRTLQHVLDAFFPRGILRAIRIGMMQAWRRFNFDEWILSRLDADVVPRSTPHSVLQRIYRSKLTFSVIPIQVYLFWKTLNSHHEHLKFRIAREWAFSGNAFSKDALKSILLSPFLHWDWSHFLFNMIMTVVYCGLLEYLAGTAYLSVCYFIPLVLANPVTYGLLILPMKWIAPKMWLSAFLEPDVGSSLGIYGVIGALVHFFKRGRLLIWGFGASALLYAVLVHSIIPLNHIIAMGMGYVIGSLLLSFDGF